MRSLELEKQKLEETVFALEESRAQLERELRFAKAKVQRLEDAQDDLAEERLLLREQRSLLQEGLQEPQLSECSLPSLFRAGPPVSRFFFLGPALRLFVCSGIASEMSRDTAMSSQRFSDDVFARHTLISR